MSGGSNQGGSNSEPPKGEGTTSTGETSSNGNTTDSNTSGSEGELTIDEMNELLSDSSSSLRNSVDLSEFDLDELLDGLSKPESTKSPTTPIPVNVSTPDTTQQNEDPRLNEMAKNIEKHLGELNILMLEKQRLVDSINRSIGGNVPLPLEDYFKNRSSINNLETEINKILDKLTANEISYIQEKTNYFNKIGGYIDKFQANHPDPPLSEKSQIYLIDKRKSDIENLIREIDQKKYQLNESLNDREKTANALEREYKNNQKIDFTLNHAKAITKKIDQLEREINEKLNSFAPTNEEMKTITEKTGIKSYIKNNQLVIPKQPYTEAVENLVFDRKTPTPIIPPTTQSNEIPPLSSSVPPQRPTTPLPPIGSELGSRRTSIPPKPNTPITTNPTQEGNATVSIGGTVVSNDWVQKKDLAEAIRKAMKTAIKDAVQNDPALKIHNLTLNIKNIDLSTPQKPSSGLKGIEVTSTDPDKKISFTATPESISGKGNTENLKAMSIEIVKNLETRIAHGGTNLKINLGDCQPPSVKDEFSKLINEQLTSMLEKNRSNPNFANYNMQKLGLPITPSNPTASAIITPINPSSGPNLSSPSSSF